jgi:hypothetical protein
MRTAAAIVFGLALAGAAFGADGAPSRQVLAEMGLSGMQILSDDQAANIRGTGFVGWEGFDLFKHSLRDFQKQVWQFKKQVKKFDKKIDQHMRQWPTSWKPPKDHGMKPPKDHGMKPPKMPHGGKPW